MSAERTSHLRAATAIRRLLQEGVARGLGRGGRGGAGASHPGGDRGRAGDAADARRAGPDRAREDGRRGRRLRAHAARARRGPCRHDFRLWRIAARHAKPIFVENAAASRLLPAGAGGGAGVEVLRRLPAAGRGRTLGLVLCSHTTAPRQWSNEERQLVEQLALEGSLVVENAALRATEQERLDELAHQAFHDSLTELPNRALFADRLGPGARAHGPAQGGGRGAVPGPGRLQADQRPLRPRRRRPPAEGGGRAGARLRAARGHRGAPRRRRVHGPARGHRRRPLRDRRRRAHRGGAARAVPDRRARGHRHGEHRDRRQQRPGRDARGPAAQLRPGDVPGQAQGPRAARAVCRCERYRGCTSARGRYDARGRGASRGPASRSSLPRRRSWRARPRSRRRWSSSTPRRLRSTTATTTSRPPLRWRPRRPPAEPAEPEPQAPRSARRDTC